MDYLPFVAIDVETANYDCTNICQFGFASFLDGALQTKNAILVNPECEFEPRFNDIHGITQDMVKGCPSWDAVHPTVKDYLNAEVVLSHTYFDKDAIGKACTRYMLPLPTPKIWVDTCSLARHIWPDMVNHKLPTLAEYFNISYHAHDASEDARCADEIFVLAVNASGRSMQDVIKKYAMSWPSSMYVRMQTAAQPVQPARCREQRAVAPPALRSAPLTPDELLDLRHNWPPQPEVNKVAPSVAASPSEQAQTAQTVLAPSFRESGTLRPSWILPLGWAILILFLLALLFYLSI